MVGQEETLTISGVWDDEHGRDLDGVEVTCKVKDKQVLQKKWDCVLGGYDNCPKPNGYPGEAWDGVFKFTLPATDEPNSDYDCRFKAHDAAAKPIWEI